MRVFPSKDKKSLSVMRGKKRCLMQGKKLTKYFLTQTFTDDKMSTLNTLIKMLPPQIFFSGPPVASQQSLQQLARLGDEVKLHCPMQGYPTPIIEWYKGEEVIDYLWSRYRPNKRTLKIKDVEKGDSGRFVCRGINGFGKEQIEIDLVVIDPKDFPDLPEGELPDVTPPRLTEETKMYRDTFDKSPEENLKISCSAVGKPRPKVTWYKNGHELLENVREKNGRSTLSLRNLMQRDSGTYTCSARNLVGEERRDFVLNVEEAELIENPEFPHGPMNRTVREGETATFDCRVRSSTAPHIKWLKELEGGGGAEAGVGSNVIVLGDKNYLLIHTTRDIPVGRESEYLSQLVLSGAEAKDAGMYICLVTSKSKTLLGERMSNHSILQGHFWPPN